MPAVAVTDRNNLFGALEFAQYAAKGGIQPITGCELGIRREDGTGNSPPGKVVPADWLTLLVQNETGYRNLMRLVSRAHLEFKAGSLSALPLSELEGNTEGLLALVGYAGSALGRLLLAGQTPAAIASTGAAAVPVRRPALPRAAAPWRGGRAADRAGAARSRLRARRAAGRHQRRALPQGRDVRGARRAAVHRAGCAHRGSQPTPADAGALLQVGGRDAPGLRRPARSLRQHPDDRPPLRLHAGAAQADPAALHQARRPRREGRPEGDGRDRPDGPEGQRSPVVRHRVQGLPGPPGLRARHDREDGLLGLLPDRRRLHPVGQGPRHPGRARPWLGRGLAGRLVAQDHRSRPLALGPDLRALPQSRARVDAGLRYRLLPGQARPGHSLRARRIRPRPRGRHHHLRQAAGEGGAA